MKNKYFKMTCISNNQEVRLINPTIIFCPQHLADAYSIALTKGHQMQGGSNSFKFVEIDQFLAQSLSNNILQPEEVKEEIFSELERGYTYSAKSDTEADLATQKAQEDFDKLTSKHQAKKQTKTL